MDESARRGSQGTQYRDPSFERSSGEAISCAGPGQDNDLAQRIPLRGALPAGTTVGDVQARAAAGAAAALPRCVLLVDDNCDARTSLAELLRTIGHRVVVAADGPESISLLDAGQTFDVALLDIGLPGMSGDDLAQLLRRRFAMSTLRLVALSGYGRAPGSARNNAFDDYFVKPVEIDALVDSICKAGHTAACGAAR